MLDVVNPEPLTPLHAATAGLYFSIRRNNPLDEDRIE